MSLCDRCGNYPNICGCAEAETYKARLAEVNAKAALAKAGSISEAQALRDILAITADSASVCLHQIHNGDTCEICGAKVTPVVQPERCCVDYPRCDCNSPPEPGDATSAQLAEAQRFPHGAAAVTGCDMKINDEGRSNAAHWYERAMKAEARLQKVMARCADLLDEDQFNELDAIARTADSASVVDTPSSPPLSSDDEHTQDQEYIEACFGKDTSEEAANRRAMPRPSAMERSSLPSVYSVSDAQSLAEVAAAIRGIAYREKTVQGFEPKTEIRIPMRLLFRLVHGEGSLG